MAPLSLLLLALPALPARSADAWSPVDHTLWQAIAETRVKNGKVEYSVLRRDSSELKLYLKSLAELPEAQVEALRAAKSGDPKAKAEWLALWLNAYNAYTIQLILDNGIPPSIKDIPKRWDLPVVKVAGKSYSLDDVEHKILRPEGDARIHFALVCASKGCPPLASFAYSGRELDSQLDGRVRAAIAAGAPWYSLDREKRVLTVTKVFDWFDEDFVKCCGGRLPFLIRFVPAEDKAFLEDDFVHPKGKKGKIKSFDYDWSLNAG